MQYALIWLEWLLIAVFFVIFWIAVFCRFKNETLRLLGSFIAAAIPGVLFISFSCLSLLLHIIPVRPTWLFFYCASLTLTYLVSAIVLLILAHQKTDAGPRAKHWPLLKYALVLIFLISINSLTFYLSEKNFKHKLEKKFVSLKARVADLLPEPQPPTQNAAFILEKKVAPLLKKIDRKFLKTVNEPDFDATSADARNFLSQYKDALDLLHEAANMPFFQYSDPIDRMLDMEVYGKFDLLLPHKSVRLLALEARSHSQQGKIDKALESLIAIQRLAKFYSCCPDPMSVFYTANGLERSAFLGLENLLYDNKDTKIEISNDILLLDDMPQQEDILRALAASEAIYIALALDTDPWYINRSIFDLFPQKNYLMYLIESLFKRPIDWLGSWLHTIFFIPSNIEFNDWLMVEMRHLAQSDPKDALKKAKALVQCPPDYSIIEIVHVGGCSYEGSDLFMFRSLYRGKAYRRLEKLALATTAYYNDTGRYPDTLKALAPEYISHIPIDPYDPEGGKMKLKPYGKGIMLYSNGDFERDDGGRVKKKNVYGDDDIVMILGEKRPGEEENN